MKPTKMEKHRLDEILGALRERPRTTVAQWGNATVYDLMAHIAALEDNLAGVRQQRDNDSRALEAAHARYAALEAEVAQAREMALEEMRPVHSALMEAATSLQTKDMTRVAVAMKPMTDALLALKSKPAQALGFVVRGDAAMAPGTFRLEPGVADYCPEARPNRRREHEYGEEARVEFGSFVAACVRPGCQAFRVKNRKKTHTSFRQSPDGEPTIEPGPCEVES